MHIAIEGMDGVGKTSTAKLLAEKLNFQFIDKPLHLLLDDEKTYENYFKISSFINSQNDNNIKAVFYGLGNIYICDRYQNSNIVTDRHLVSNYFWNSTTANSKFFEYLVEVCGKPDFTILLYTNTEIRRKRIMKRNELDSDLLDVFNYPDAYERMKCFLQTNSMKYCQLDNSELTLEDTVSSIIELLKSESLL